MLNGTVHINEIVKWFKYTILYMSLKKRYYVCLKLTNSREGDNAYLNINPNIL